MTNEAKLKECNRVESLIALAANRLREHVDSVQVIATRTFADGSTVLFHCGHGDRYARKGAANTWIDVISEEDVDANTWNEVISKEDVDAFSQNAQNNDNLGNEGFEFGDEDSV